MLKTAYGLDDPGKAWWAVACSSLILGHSVCRLTVPEVTRPLAQPIVSSTPSTLIYLPEALEYVRPFLAYRQPENIQTLTPRFPSPPPMDLGPRPVGNSYYNSRQSPSDDLITLLNRRHPRSDR
jgi:hypothetical protein